MTRWPLVALAPVFASAVAAQSARVSGSTSLRYIELRPFVRDSVLQTTAPGTALLRQLPDGRVVRCVPGETYCRDVHAGDALSTIPVIQDLEASVWGVGRGVQLFTQLRGRAAAGEASDLWPRSDDAFDVLAAWAEMARERYRVRAGRQWKVSGLGFYNFDGVNVAFDPKRVAVELYAGRSLVRGMNEALGGAAGAIEGIGELKPGILAGAQLRYRRGERFAFGANYHLDVAADRRSLYSELAAVDAAFTHTRVSVESALEADVASAALNEARLTARATPLRQTSVLAEVRRYRPYFELWTIWGAFSPFAFDEARGAATWSDRTGALSLRGETAYRIYRDNDAVRGLGGVRSSGWSARTGAGWTPRRDWRLDGSYGLDAGFGAARLDASVGITRFIRDASLATQLLYFERLYEFRLDEGAVLGASADASLPLGDRLQAAASFALYRQNRRSAGSRIDWNQRRASVRLQWTMGAEPRMALPVQGAPR